MSNPFPRTTVGGVSLPRILIGTNWFLGYSHQTPAKDRAIKARHCRNSIAEVLEVFLAEGIDAIMGPSNPLLKEAADEAESRTGKKVIRILTPSFSILPDEPAEQSPEAMLDQARDLGATFCMPHQCVTDRLLDKLHFKIRDLPKYTKMIRDRGMIPGLSTHTPESIVFSDKNDYDVETYIQLYNSAGFLMQVEVDWIMRIISNAKKPVMTIKPFAAGRIAPAIALPFVWNTIREQDMVTVGTTTPDEAREVIDISRDILAGRIPGGELQATRSKAVLKY